MTPTRARQLVEAIAIRTAEHDSEAAHSLEDKARDEFITRCASGRYENPAELRKVAGILAETSHFDFHRWTG